MNIQPAGWGRRVLGELVLILAVAYGARLAASLPEPLVPTLLVLVGLGTVFSLVFRRR